MIKDIKQIIPSAICLKCDICCRYPEKATVFTPYFLSGEIKKDKICFDPKPPPIPYKDRYICQFFTPDKNTCSVYHSRPFDCRLYPFMITYDKSYQSTALVLDTKCPYLINKTGSKEFKEYLDYLINILEDNDIVWGLNKNKNFINSFQEDSIVLKRLENLSKRLCFSGYGLRRISMKDKKIFDEYFEKINTKNSNFSFKAIYIWSGVLNILWKKINDALCVFAGNDGDYFLFLPPIDVKFDKAVIKEALKILSDLNKGTTVSPRIENIPEEFYDAMLSCGLKLKISSCEYIYSQKELSQLQGDKLKSKRASVNDFIKNYKYTIRQIKKDDAFLCLDLYRKWAGQKSEKTSDEYSKFLIQDSYLAQKTALMNLEELNLQGLGVEIGGEIKGYTLGYPLNKDVFVVLFETTDLNIKGLSQFIFKEFCSQLSNYKYINTLTDSGLENLKKVKESYRPIQISAIFFTLPE